LVRVAKRARGRRGRHDSVPVHHLREGRIDDRQFHACSLEKETGNTSIEQRRPDFKVSRDPGAAPAERSARQKPRIDTDETRINSEELFSVTSVLNPIRVSSVLIRG